MKRCWWISIILFAPVYFWYLSSNFRLVFESRSTQSPANDGLCTEVWFDGQRGCMNDYFMWRGALVVLNSAASSENQSFKEIRIRQSGASLHLKIAPVVWKGCAVRRLSDSSFEFVSTQTDAQTPCVGFKLEMNGPPNAAFVTLDSIVLREIPLQPGEIEESVWNYDEVIVDHCSPTSGWCTYNRAFHIPAASVDWVFVNDIPEFDNVAPAESRGRQVSESRSIWHGVGAWPAQKSRLGVTMNTKEEGIPIAKEQRFENGRASSTYLVHRGNPLQKMIRYGAVSGTYQLQFRLNSTLNQAFTQVGAVLQPKDFEIAQRLVRNVSSNGVCPRVVPRIQSFIPAH